MENSRPPAWAKAPSSTPRRRQIRLRAASNLGQPRPDRRFLVAFTHRTSLFHPGARLHQALRSAAVHLLRVPQLHRAELRPPRKPSRLRHLRLDARPHLALLRPPGQHVESVCLEVPGLLYALAPRELTATAQTRKLPQEVLPLNLASVTHSPLRTCRVGLQRCALLAVRPAVAPRVSTYVDTLPACSRAARAHVCSRRPHAFSIDAPSHAAGQPWVGPGKPSA